MKNLLKKSLTTLGITACLFTTISTVSFASLGYDSYAQFTGYNGQATLHAYTSQYNEPANDTIEVSATLNDGSSGRNVKNYAAATDSIHLDFTSKGKVNSGNSLHEWVSADSDGVVSKVVDFFY